MHVLIDEAAFYDSIELPIFIPRSMFDRELDYFGITSSKDCITDQMYIARTLQSFEKPLALAKREHEMFLLALECNYQFCRSDTASQGHAYVSIPKDHNLFNGKALDSNERKLFDNYLDRYFGLKVDLKLAIYRSGNKFQVCMK